MKLLFLSIGEIPSINANGIYPDLLRFFVKKGQEVFIVCSRERKTKMPTQLIEEDGAKILKVHIGNITKTNIIEKGISTVLIEHQYKSAISKYFYNIRFDLVIYSTPPITLAGVVEYIKKRDKAKTYLLLKDIFPQNAVDLGLLSTSGLKGLIYNYFRKKEKKLYALSDRIGCMSQANVDYLVKHNKEINPSKVEICPNSIEIIDKSVDDNTKEQIRIKYGIPLNRKVFLYGGNLGKPQGIPFIIDCIKRCEDLDAVFFLIVGDGTEYDYLNEFLVREKPRNMKLMRRLSKNDYDNMVGACDVGLLFLDCRFTIPNFPSRMLSYMQAKIPILACTDTNTDIGQVIVDGGFGWWCNSCSSSSFFSLIKKIVDYDLDKTDREKEFCYLKNHYSVDVSYKTIMRE